jgi:uncharacterized membrane protein YfcA
MHLERIGKATGTDIVGTAVRWTYIVMLIGLSSFMLYDYFVLRLRKAEREKHHELPGPEIKSFAEKIRKIKIPPLVSYKKSRIGSISIWVIVVIFFFCGFISGFLGVGGGFIRMPALIYLIGCPTALAIGTDLFIIMLDGAYGCFTYALKGRVEVFAAVIMLFGAAIGAQIGVTAVKYIRGYGIRIMFAVMVMFAGLSVMLKQIESITKIVIFGKLSGIVIIGSAMIISIIIIIRLFYNAHKEKKLKVNT